MREHVLSGKLPLKLPVRPERCEIYRIFGGRSRKMSQLAQGPVSQRWASQNQGPIESVMGQVRRTSSVRLDIRILFRNISTCQAMTDDRLAKHIEELRGEIQKISESQAWHLWCSLLNNCPVTHKNGRAVLRLASMNPADWNYMVLRHY